MKILAWLRHELRSVLLATAYFAACFGVLMLLKRLMLQGYGIAFSGVTAALLLALVTGKVVVVLDRAPLRHRIGLVEVAMRTVLYTLVALGLLVLEEAISSRAEAGGVLPALAAILGDPEMPRVWATAICVGLAFAGYTAFSVIRREVGTERLAAAFLGRPHPDRESPPPRRAGPRAS